MVRAAYMEDDYEGWLANRPSLTEDRSHPNHWRNRAADLKASAGAVWHSMGSQDSFIAEELGYAPGYRMGVACWSVYHMLCGLSLEVIIKAVLIRRGTPPQKIETHSFMKLHDFLGVEMDDERKRLMAFYEAALVWSGRYPTPRNASDDKLLRYYELADEVLMTPLPMGEKSTIQFKVASGSTDWQHYSALWSSYAGLFESRR